MTNAAPAREKEDSLTTPARRPGWLPLHAIDIQIYRVVDDLSGWLILPLLVFTPWAFGTTQVWAIQCLNSVEYGLGLLLFIKLFIRAGKGYPAPRWDNYSSRTGGFGHRGSRTTRRFQWFLAALTLGVLAECVVSAWNAASTYLPETGEFRYFKHLAWLPYSVDGGRTWTYFRMYLGQAAAFWATADWLGGATLAEEVAFANPGKTSHPQAPPVLPARLQQMLWVICVNGGILGLEAIAQRHAGTDKLLFFYEPRLNHGAATQFGPYAYRSNAAQYFNLIWPVCVGFWSTLRRSGKVPSSALHVLLACAAIMAACPTIATSRLSAGVSAGLLLFVTGYLILTGFQPKTQASPQASSPDADAPAMPAPQTHWPAHESWTGLAIFLVLAAGLVAGLGWHDLAKRLPELAEGYAGRESIYATAAPMAKDYPWFGTGPGTFATAFQLYRFSDDTFWPEFLHNDWLETRITFGWVGLALLLAAAGTVMVKPLYRGGLRGNRRLVVTGWLSLTGCFLQGWFDFPFQIPGTLFLFLVLCALLFNLSCRHRHGRSGG